MDARAQPLEGITVIDLGQIYQGPYGSFLLAMAGARVVKVEPPGGERLRGSPERPPTLVLLCDISGSMSRYSRMLLHFAHTLSSARERVHSLTHNHLLTHPLIWDYLVFIYGATGSQKNHNCTLTSVSVSESDDL